MLKKSMLILIFLSSIAIPSYFYKRLTEKLEVVERYAVESLQMNAVPLARPISEDGFSKYKVSNKLCHRLSKVPMADEIGIVTAVHDIHLSDIDNPYNGSLIEADDGFLLIFRHDDWLKNPVDGTYSHYNSHISCAALDRKFSQSSPSFTFNTNSHISQDPRAFRLGKDIYIIYNDVVTCSLFSRQMHLAKVDLQDYSLKDIRSLDLNIQPVEKNWVPFVMQNGDNSESVYFEYACNPHKIIKVNTDTNDIQQYVFPSAAAYQNLPWPKCLGEIRGGTPAVELSEGYLSFFHSSFKEDKIKWYVMGAYLFEKAPPFRIIAMSGYPILFKGIYSTEKKGVSNPKLKCIFPSGIVLTKENDRDVVYVSCGENDCAQKIITVDLQSLLQSLCPIPAR